MIKSFHEYLGQDNLVQDDYLQSFYHFFNACILDKQYAMIEPSPHPDGVYPISDGLTINFPKGFVIIGNFEVRMIDGTIDINHQKMFNFRSNSGQPIVVISAMDGDITLDMNAGSQAQPQTPYELQHCHTMQIQSTGPRGWGHVLVHGVIIKNRIGDGISINGYQGLSTNTFGSIHISKISEPTETPDVRATVSVQNSFDNFMVKDCLNVVVEIEHDSIDDNQKNLTILKNVVCKKRLDINNKNSSRRPHVILEDVSGHVDNLNLKTSTVFTFGDFGLTWDNFTHDKLSLGADANNKLLA